MQIICILLYKKRAPERPFLSAVVESLRSASGSLEALPVGSYSIYPLGGVFWGMGAPKSVEQGASYSEGYMRYRHRSRASIISHSYKVFNLLPVFLVVLLAANVPQVGLRNYFGIAARPAAVMRPRCSKSAQRCLFSSVQ